jgi:drug/metabolite transporter (DMT)-like permease
MLLFFALLAAVGCAGFNGVAAVLEKIGAGKEETATSSHPGLLWRLRGNAPYLAGVGLDLLAWVLTLFAVHNLPLFLVQPIIACSVLVTLLIEHYFFGRRFSNKFVYSAGAILVGLVLLASVSTPERAVSIAHGLRLWIILLPLAIAAIGSVVAAVQDKYATFILAGLSGVAFGGVSIAGRAIVFSHPYAHILTNYLVWAIVGYGLCGILFFTIALQRASASAVNATMIACETLFPIIMGLVFLGDHPTHKLWLVVIIGIVCTFSGTIFIAMHSDKN